MRLALCRLRSSQTISPVLIERRDFFPAPVQVCAVNLSASARIFRIRDDRDPTTISRFVEEIGHDRCGMRVLMFFYGTAAPLQRVPWPPTPSASAHPLWGNRMLGCSAGRSAIPTRRSTVKTT
jgi:hypothetical protein